MGYQQLVYKIVLLLHLSSVVVGFGSAFVYPLVTAKARGLSAREAYILSNSTLAPSRMLTAYPIIAAGVFGALLVVLSEEVYKFSQTWVSIAFLLWIAAVAVTFFLVQPNLKAVDTLGAKLAAGDVTVSKAGGEPKEAVELQERMAKGASFSGIMHTLWFLLMIDMIWKPGL